MAKRRPSLSSSRPTLPNEAQAQAFISGEEKPPKETRVGERKPQKKTSTRRKQVKKEASYPWESPDVSAERKKVLNLRLPEPYHVKLKYIREKTGKVAHRICLDAVLPAIDAEIKRILKEGK